MGGRGFDKKPKQPDYNKGNFGFALSSANATKPRLGYPIFCLRHIVQGYAIDDCDKKLKGLLVSKLYNMSQSSWSTLENTDHKRGGFEQIPKGQFNVKFPAIITEDVGKLHIMRFNGKTGRIIGLRSDDIFHVTHIEIDKSAYEHGR